MWQMNDITPLALSMLEGVEEGASLDAFSAAMIKLAVTVSVTSLNPDCIRQAIAECRAAGGDIAQIQEIIALVSGLGMHALMVSSTMLLTEDEKLAPPLDAKRQALWDRYVGATAYWDEFEREVPGFLMALLRVSPEGFKVSSSTAPYPGPPAWCRHSRKNSRRWPATRAPRTASDRDFACICATRKSLVPAGR